MNPQTAAATLELLKSLGDVDSWCGATHLQKTAYFLQALMDVRLDLDPDFILYKHGPYSFGLQDLIGEMTAYGLVRSQPNPPPYGPSLRLTDSGRKLLGQFGPGARHPEEACFVAQHLGTRGVVELEKLGTALFVKRAWGNLSPQEQAQKVNQLKPHVSVEDAMKAGEEVARLEQEASGVGVPG